MSLYCKISDDFISIDIAPGVVFADNKIRKENVLCNESLNSLAVMRVCKARENSGRGSKIQLNVTSSKK